MMIEEITEKIIESRNNDIAKAFTMHISSLLLNNGIVPIMTEYSENDVKNIEDTDEYKIVMEYGVAFKKLDCTEHDKKIYNKAIDDFIEKIIDCIDGEFMYQFKYFPAITMREIAERLKVGDNNGT